MLLSGNIIHVKNVATDATSGKGVSKWVKKIQCSHLQGKLHQFEIGGRQNCALKCFSSVN